MINGLSVGVIDTFARVSTIKMSSDPRHIDDSESESIFRIGRKNISFE